MIWPDGTWKPDSIDPRYCVSASQCNERNDDKIDRYITRREESDPPAILGWWDRIDLADVGTFFMNGVEIEKHHVGDIVFFVTDGHHRTWSSLECGCYLQVKPAREAMTTQAQLDWYDSGVWQN